MDNNSNIPPVPPTPKGNPQPLPDIPASIPVKNNVNIADTKLNKAAQEKFLEKRRELPLNIKILKYVSLFIAIIVFAGYGWLKVDLDPENSFLSLFGLPENTGTKFQKNSDEHKKISTENDKVLSKIAERKYRIENEDYFIHTKTINEIRNNQLAWLDNKNPENDRVTLGILNSFERMENYFNSKSYSHPILSGNYVEINNIALDRTNVSFTITTSNLFGKIFFLNLEFVDMINSFPFFKNGKIKNFIRKKDENGDDSMTASLKIQIQMPEETDPADEKFEEYEAWLLNINSKKSSSKPKPKRKASSEKSALEEPEEDETNKENKNIEGTN
ncbi:MAG: hypothetical protein OEL89_03845 [Candidatus Peregrinibacteria bacterium]|nr:hypothetical protein [Candidatus Peregrinibacteria bacterium]